LVSFGQQAARLGLIPSPESLRRRRAAQARVNMAARLGHCHQASRLRKQKPSGDLAVTLTATPQGDLVRLSVVSQSLEIVRSVTPEPGKIAAHVEFDKSGQHALVSVWEDKGALVIYDATTFAEVKRLPMSKPSGKYNVWNKINFSDGTSH